MHELSHYGKVQFFISLPFMAHLAAKQGVVSTGTLRAKLRAEGQLGSIGRGHAEWQGRDQ